MKQLSPCLLAGALFFGALEANNILFLANQGRHEEACSLLKGEKCSDDRLIEETALAILRHGVEAKDKDEALLALFGASIAVNEKAELLIEKACRNSNPEIQLAALSMMARSKSDSSLAYLNQALGAPHPLIRLEVAFLIAERKAPGASIKIESLMHKFPKEVHFLFPRLFAMVGDEEAKRNLRRLLSHPDEKVRTEAILAIGKTGRDDLGREIRRALTHPDAGSKEAAAVSAKLLKDEEAIPLLEKLQNHPSTNVRVAALSALRTLNRPQATHSLEEIAITGNIFAINELSDSPQSKPVLATLLKHPDKTVRANATLALLKLKDDRALLGLKEILIKDRRDIGYIPAFSSTGALTAIKAIPSARENLAEGPALFELSLLTREQALEGTINLSDEAFYTVAETVLREGQNDLIPLLMSLLEAKGKASLPLLRKAEQMTGAPYIRNWAALTLFKLREDGYQEKLKTWLKQEAKMDLVKFRPFVPWEMRKGTPYDINPNEKASLWIAILEGLIQDNPDNAVDFLIELIAQGSGNNRYVFAGILLRSIQ
ncbi:MAG: HEAT repeat domain-containing protein [Chlamydiia bacterium]|nr:HEAT repeat domain-containing protein [Chlamydiia bacterium]